MKTRAPLAAGALVATLAVAGVAVAAQPTAPNAKPTAVTVSMYEMGFKLSRSVVPRGTVVFRVANDGKLEHDFRISGQGTPVLNAGERVTLNARFPRRGRFTFVCTVEGHAAAGMIGTLNVK